MRSTNYTLAPTLIDVNSEIILILNYNKQVFITLLKVKFENLAN